MSRRNKNNGVLKAIGNFKKTAAAAKKVAAEASKIKAEAKAVKANAKAKVIRAKSWKPTAKAAVAGMVATKASEEETKRQLAASQASIQKEAISKWNAAINNKAEPAEGTGDALGGNLGITVIGNE